jgi:multidrug efflux pump subunit AcrA (membrane-fusion protein)
MRRVPNGLRPKALPHNPTAITIGGMIPSKSFAAVVAFLLAAAARGGDAPAPATSAVTPATTPSTSPSSSIHVVAKGTLVPDVSGDAIFEAVGPLEVRVRAKQYAGELVVVSAAGDGALVKKGDIILQIDSAPAERELALANNELVLAEANLVKAKDDARLGETADGVALALAQKELENAGAALKWFESAEGPDMVKQAEVMLKMAKDQIEDQGDELDQLKKMYKTEDLTTATADIVVKRAVRQLSRSQEMLGITQNQTGKVKELTFPQTRFTSEQAVKKAKVALEQLESAQAQSRVARATSLVSAQIAQEKATQKVAELRLDVAQLKVAAPSDGVVYWGFMQNGAWQNPNPRALLAGEKAAAQQILLTLAYPGKLRAVLNVPENKLAFVVAGQAADVAPKLLPERRYEGKVSSIARTATARGGVTGFEVEIDAGDLDGRLSPGMTAVVKVETAKIEDVVVVPVGAVEGNKVKVMVEGKGEVEREVVTGRSDGKMVEIVKGLGVGEKVTVKQ